MSIRTTLSDAMSLKTLLPALTTFFSLYICGCGPNKLVMLAQEQSTLHQQCRVELNQSHSGHLKAKDMLHKANLTLKDKSSELEKARELVERLKKQQSPSGGRIIHNLNAEQIVAIARSVGADINVHDGKLVTSFKGLKALVGYNPQTHTLLSQARFKGKGNLGLVNTWNRTKGFSRAYLDTNLDLVLEADIDIRAGVSPQTLQVWFAHMKVSMFEFSKAVSQAQSQEKRELSRLSL